MISFVLLYTLCWFYFRSDEMDMLILDLERANEVIIPSIVA